MLLGQANKTEGTRRVVQANKIESTLITERANPYDSIKKVRAS